MYRRQENDLRTWFTKENRKPLVIRGARQVGKSTLVRQFCKNENIELYEINLEKNFHLNDVFATKDVKRIVNTIEDVIEKKLNLQSKCLLFLDEIQATPAALPSLRYFFEELPSLAVASAGSLLEFILNDHNYSMPVGRIEFLYMGPMSFTEFLIAKNENYLIEKMKSTTSIDAFSSTFHQRAAEHLREFLFVGGMPEAVKTAVEKDIESASEIHAQIIQTYQADFVKYSRKSHLSKIQKVFRYTFLNPCQKIKYSNISKDDLSRDLKNCLQLLEQAKVVAFVRHTKCNGLPLEASEEEAIFKTLVLDVGLMNHLHRLSWTSFRNASENETLIEGAIAEQFIGQHLLYQQPSYLEPKLHYWLREGKSHNAEVDYIITKDSKMFAIEVKAGAAGKMRSLHQWMLEIKYQNKTAIRFNLSPAAILPVHHRYGDHEVNYKVFSLPLYLVEHWDKYLKQKDF